MANIAYVRVSTKEQNTGRQFQCFESKGIKLDKTYEEHIPQFELKEFDIAKEQLNKQEQTQMLVRGNQEQMER